MRLLLTKILTAFLLILLLVPSGKAQVTFSAMATPEEIGIDEYVQFRLIIENSTSIQQLSPPSFEPFTLLGQPSQESGINNINGQISKYIALGFVLKPTRTGTFTLGAATAKIGGQVYKSKPVVIKVSKQSSSQQPPSIFSMIDPMPAPAPNKGFEDFILKKGEDVTEKVKRNMQLRLDVDKTSCYVGEPIVATYKLYTRLKSDSRLAQNPSFNGFSVIDMKEGNDFTHETASLQGKEYNVYTIRKSQLYALQPGTIALEPAELENNLQFIKEEYAGSRSREIIGYFDDLSMALPPDAIVRQTVGLTNQPVSIVVKPLPEAGKPMSFTGAVGQFEIKASVKKKEFSTDESGILEVVVSGKGNMQLLTIPEIEWPQGIESYEPKVADRINNATVPISGIKTFEYSFSADNAGAYTIPAIVFSYFDPVSATYKTVQTPPIECTVSKGTGINTDTAALHPQKLSFINRIFHHRWWIVLFVAFVVLTSLFFWIKKESKSASHEKMHLEKEEEPEMIKDTFNQQIIETVQQNPLQQTEDCLGRTDCASFYSLLNTELKTFLSGKLRMPVNAISSNTVMGVMDQRGISNDIILQLQDLMREIEWQLYTPFERTEKMNELYGQAQSVIQMINLATFRHQ